MIVGIDLGTTNSLVAIYEEDGPRLIPNGRGDFLTPSVVGLDEEGQVLIGAAARARLVSHPDMTAALFKRRMGVDTTYSLGQRDFRPEELSALVLKELVASVERELGQRPDEAVISVPAYFNDIQRKATKAAAELAGLKVRRLINEPTAAALAYGLQDRDGENTFLMIDLGGGTFDVSILEMFEGVMEIRATAGDAFLGGEDYTQALADWLCTKLERSPASLSAESRSWILEQAEKLKRALTERDQASLRLVLEGQEHEISLSRTEFDSICDGITERLRLPVQRALRDSDLKSRDIDRILLVGGATRMPVVRNSVTRLFGRFPEIDIDPDHAVALGAAVQAALADRHEALEDMVMTDVCPFTLGVDSARKVGEKRVVDDVFVPLIERNTVVPVSRIETFSPLHEGQKKVLFRIYQGESPRSSENIFLGDIELPLLRDKGETVDCRFTYDISGILEVIVCQSGKGQERRLVIEGNPGVMSRDEIERRLKDLDRLKIRPEGQVENVEIMARLEKLYENSLGDNRQWAQSRLLEFRATLDGQDRKEIAEHREKLKEILEQIERDDVF